MAQRTLEGDYRGRAFSLFLIAAWTGFLTLVTLGIYRFWAKARIRRYVWSATRPGGDPFEYTGTGLEKFLGFLLAVVMIAVYLGVIQIVLMLFGFSLLAVMTGEAVTITEIVIQTLFPYLVLLLLSPLIFFAQYRGRRYMMSRTRWRGIRFGMDRAALGYVWRGVATLLATILTAGLLWPLMTWTLERYKAVHMYYGDRRFAQDGSWYELYGPFKHVMIGAALAFGAPAALAAGGLNLLAIIAFAVGSIWLSIGFIVYRVRTFGLMMGYRSLEGGMTFDCEPSAGLVVLYRVLGYIFVAAAFLLAFAPFVALLWPQLSGTDLDEISSLYFALGSSVVTLAVGYLFALTIAIAVAQAFVAQPILAHYVNATTLNGADKLDYVRQTAADDFADADGFADALDVGGAF